MHCEEFFLEFREEGLPLFFVLEKWRTIQTSLHFCHLSYVVFFYLIEVSLEALKSVCLCF